MLLLTGLAMGWLCWAVWGFFLSGLVLGLVVAALASAVRRLVHSLL